MVGLAGCFKFQNVSQQLVQADILACLDRVRAVPGVQYHIEVCSSARFIATNALRKKNEESTIHYMKPLDGRYFILVHGEIINLSDIKNTSVASLPSDDVASVLMAHFASKGIQFVEDLKGPFSILIFDTLNNELFLFTDQFGSRPIYFYEERGIVYFGSEKKFILCLIKDPVKLDPVGLLQVFAHQHNIGTRTFIHGLGSLPAYSVLSVSGNDLKVSTVKYFGFSAPKQMSFREGVLQWSALLRNNVAKCIQGKKVALQLSGGFDSRAIACAVSRNTRPFTSITRIADNPLEARYAKQIATKLGFQHYTLSPTYPSEDYISSIVWRTECTISYHHSRSIENIRLLKNLADYLMGGQFGDISSGAHIAKYMYEPINTKLFPEKVYQHYVVSIKSLRLIFTDDFLNEYLPRVKSSFIDSFKSIAEKDNVNTYQVWDQKERQSNFILRAGMVQRYVMEGIYPFLDFDYLSFITSVPDKWRRDQLMYRAVIHYLGPEVRNVPNANNGSKVHGSLFANQLEQWVLENRELLKKQTGLKSKLIKTEMKNFIFSRDKRSIELVRSFLRSEYFDAAIFNATGIETLLQSGDRISASDNKLLKTLATFAIGLRMFIYNVVIECPETALQHLAIS